MSIAKVTRNSLSEGDLFLEPDLTGADLHGTRLVLANLSRAELLSASLDGANAGLAARAGRVSPSAPAGHRLQLPLGELAAFFSER